MRKREYNKRLISISLYIYFRASRGENYEELKKKDIKPFNLNYNKKPPKTAKTPALTVEVTVMPGKNCKIPLHNSDNPIEVACNFAKIYHLSKEEQESLEIALKEQIQNLNEN